MQPKRHEILDDLVRIVQSSISDVADTIAVSTKEEIAENVLREIVHNWGGLNVYIPKNWLFEVSERKLEIYKRYNGTNHTELAREYGLSVQYIYRIVKQVGEAERKRTQPDLFE